MTTAATSTSGANNPSPLSAEERQTNSTTAPNHNQRGNLHSLLKAYDETMKTNPTNEESNNTQNNVANDTSTIGERVIEGNDSISVQLDNMGRERSSTLGSIRERGLTFGSEFDLGLGLTNDNVAHDDLFDLSAVNGQQGQIQGGQGQVQVQGGLSKDKGALSSSAGERIDPNNMKQNQNQSQLQRQRHQMKMNPPQTHSSSMPQDNPVQHGFNTSSSVVSHNTATTTTQHQQQDNMQNDSSSISAGFLNRLFGSNTNPNQSQQQQQQQQQHTPPSATATSYEIKHFGKRLRSGVCISILFLVCKAFFNYYSLCRIISCLIYNLYFFLCF
jgi:hypothetical protein